MTSFKLPLLAWCFDIPGEKGVKAGAEPSCSRSANAPRFRLAGNAVDASFLGDAPKTLLRSEIPEMTLPGAAEFA